MNKLIKSQEFDSYEIEEPSDEERASSSSEDELDVLLNGTPDQKKKLIREYLTGESESSSGDEFEKEMEAELSSTIRTMEGTWAPSATAETSGGGGGGGGGPGPLNPRMYDNIYFDSDSEGEDTPSSSTGQRRRQRIIPTNDELLYDPDEDDRDQAWVDARRRQYNSRKRPAGAFRSQSRRTQGLPSSDAVLNCPACMTTLCLDCQRHEKYRTQYRAMFVMNCTVKKDEVLRYKTQQEKKQRNRKRRRGQKTETPANEAPDPSPAGMDADEVYHPVQCSECSTEVAVFDKEEVYHFFNILASHC
ncbi:E2F-associated phosphoprotein isoform X1 [Seriola lalandi dorsalis]|uniref:E2F-associated phosphoprotein isoform X1 n=1 Tax=Seriola lalandi dorsalis TaxID=1841481 RepID=UPI000C6F9E53|nr:E2F-associated phosphoprotein isoform X1 [Seriola lalandi dorsalis]